VTVIDEQSVDPLPVDAARWLALAAAVLDAEGIGPDVELSISFVDEAAIAELNDRFMHHDGPTDVLAFPIDDEQPPAGVPRMLGDLVICPRVAERNAPEHAGGYDDEIALLLVHGVLHLAGMDHDDDADRIAMQTRERELLVDHHGTFSRDPWS
jgi:probable rRNA maturation factor